jgi:hypothetical protein
MYVYVDEMPFARFIFLPSHRFPWDNCMPMYSESLKRWFLPSPQLCENVWVMLMADLMIMFTPMIWHIYLLLFLHQSSTWKEHMKSTGWPTLRQASSKLMSNALLEIDCTSRNIKIVVNFLLPVRSDPGKLFCIKYGRLMASTGSISMSSRTQSWKTVRTYNFPPTQDLLVCPWLFEQSHLPRRE